MTDNWPTIRMCTIGCIFTSSQILRKLEFSRPVERSEITTPRSLSTISGTNARFSMRSASKSKITSRARRGTSRCRPSGFHWYIHYWHRHWSITLSNILAILFSTIEHHVLKKCARPVVPGYSLRDPTFQNKYILVRDRVIFHHHDGHAIFKGELSDIICRISACAEEKAPASKSGSSPLNSLSNSSFG